MTSTTGSILIVGLCLACMFIRVFCQNYVTVDTKSGKVRGERISVDGVKIDRYWGIPYADPPLGKNRFKQTTPVKSWKHTFDAMTPPNSCFQVRDTTFGTFRGTEMWNPNTPMSEDCLKLNIWTPSNKKNLTTLVWIFGGSFNAGTSTLDVYNPNYLVANNNIIIVSINYRIGLFGFLYFGHEDAPGNAAQFDQRLALKWIYDNIEAFGGNRNQIALFGESSGAVCIALHLLSPLSWPYFNNVILQSGAFGAHWAFQSREVALKRAYNLALLVGCGNFSSDSETIACLQKIPAETLALQQWYINFHDYYFDITFGPTVDGVFLTDYPDELTRRKQFKNTGVLAGINTNEASYFLIYGMGKLFPFENVTPKLVRYENFTISVDTLLNPIGKAQIMRDTTINEYYQSVLPHNRMSLLETIEDIAGDISFKCPTIAFSRLYTMSSARVFVYHYAHRSSFNPWPEYAGIMHGYEIDLVFGQPLNASFGYSQDEIKLSREMMRFWTNFAKTGNPNKESTTSQEEEKWLPYTNDTQHFYLLTTNGSRTMNGLRHRQCSLINDLLPKMISMPEKKKKTGSCINSSFKAGSESFLLAVAVLGVFFFNVIPQPYVEL